MLKKMKLLIMDLFSKCDQIRSFLQITFTEKIRNGEFNFWCSVG